MDVASALVARDEAAVAVDPGKRAFDHPPVPSQCLTGLDTTPCDAWSDPATAAGLSASSMVVGLVGVKLVWSASRPAPPSCDRRDAVEQFLEGHAVVGVGAGQNEGERKAIPVRDQVALRA